MTEPSAHTTGAKRTAAQRREARLLNRLREGDQQAFLGLFRAWHPSMVRVALNYVRRRSVAEEVAQETWLHFMQQLGRFRGRSSLKTWTFRILVNRAINRGKKEHRAVAIVRDAVPTGKSSGRPSAAATPRAGAVGDNPWASGGFERRTPEQRVLTAEVRHLLERALRRLPEKQQLVVTLRDVQGWDSSEVCELLEITPENQRVLLHRARMKLREVLRPYLNEQPRR